MTSISELIGKTLTKIDGNKDSEQLRFHADDGSEYVMYHSQDCCESVSIEDITGDLNDLIGSPIVQAEESTSNEHPEGVKPEFVDDSFLWSFYRLATNKGSVAIRWYGSSNGYYGESVDFEKVRSDR